MNIYLLCIIRVVKVWLLPPIRRWKGGQFDHPFTFTLLLLFDCYQKVVCIVCECGNQIFIYNLGDTTLTMKNIKLRCTRKPFTCHSPLLPNNKECWARISWAEAVAMPSSAPPSIKVGNNFTKLPPLFITLHPPSISPHQLWCNCSNSILAGELNICNLCDFSTSSLEQWQGPDPGSPDNGG